MNAYVSPSLITETTCYTCAKSEPTLLLAVSGSHEYEVFSSYIINVFRETYSAEIHVTYPLLMGLVDAEGQPLAALGIRHAAGGQRLFLENYLGQSVESYLRLANGQCVERENIAEVGNLASSGKANILLLLYSMTCFLNHKEISHILYTGTSALNRYLRNLGLNPSELTDADPALLGADAGKWGTYYATHPKVMVGCVAHRLKVLPRVATINGLGAQR